MISNSSTPDDHEDLSMEALKREKKAKAARIAVMKRSIAWQLMYIPESAPARERLITFVRAGAFPHVAAASIGIPRSSWKSWETKALQGDSLPDDECYEGVNFYADLFAMVYQAGAEARTTAEVEVRQSDPKFWLTQGPGKYDELGGWGRDNIEVRHHVDGAIEHEHSVDQAQLEDAVDSHLGAVLSALESLGITETTDRGKGMIEGTATPVDPDSV